MKTVVIFTVGMLCLPARLSGQAKVDADEHRPLSPPKASENVGAAQTAAPAHVTLTGIANLNHKCALLTIQTAGQPQKFVVLKEGETEAAVQVLHINTTNARVLVRIGDKNQLLSLTGISLTTTPVLDADHALLPTLAPADAGEL